MAKIALAAVCAILLFCTVGNATPLELRSGGISNIPFIPVDRQYSFAGDGFSVVGMWLSVGYFGGPSFNIPFINNGGIVQTRITVDGFAPCIPPPGEILTPT